MKDSTIAAWIVLAVVAYMFIGGLSLARHRSFNPVVECEGPRWEETSLSSCHQAEHNREAGAFFASILWPIYLPISLGLEAGS